MHFCSQRRYVSRRSSIEADLNITCSDFQQRMPIMFALIPFNLSELKWMFLCLIWASQLNPAWPLFEKSFPCNGQLDQYNKVVMSLSLPSSPSSLSGSGSEAVATSKLDPLPVSGWSAVSAQLALLPVCLSFLHSRLWVRQPVHPSVHGLAVTLEGTRKEWSRRGYEGRESWIRSVFKLLKCSCSLSFISLVILHQHVPLLWRFEGAVGGRTWNLLFCKVKKTGAWAYNFIHIFLI